MAKPGSKPPFLPLYWLKNSFGGLHNYQSGLILAKNPLVWNSCGLTLEFIYPGLTQLDEKDVPLLLRKSCYQLS
jgi:ABC-type cobalamin transport system permease subunit